MFAKSIGLQRSTYVRLELGQRRIDLDVFRRIAVVLKLSDTEIADLVRSATSPGDPVAADEDPHGDDEPVRQREAA